MLPLVREKHNFGHLAQVDGMVLGSGRGNWVSTLVDGMALLNGRKIWISISESIHDKYLYKTAPAISWQIPEQRKLFSSKKTPLFSRRNKRDLGGK